MPVTNLKGLVSRPLSDIFGAITRNTDWETGYSVQYRGNDLKGCRTSFELRYEIGSVITTISAVKQ